MIFKDNIINNTNEISYRRESEIDKAFEYLDKLDKELNRLKDLNNSTISFFSIFAPKNEYRDFTTITKCTVTKSENYIKDGYEFKIKQEKVYTKKRLNKPTYYTFYVDIKYYNEKRLKQFYREFRKESDSKNYYKVMSGIFKHLKRRDIMEKLFDMKLEKIKKYKKYLNQS